jgi:RNA polymerase sigma-70 factor (ECF subfamily)
MRMLPPADDRRAVFERWVEPLLSRAAAYAYGLMRNRADAEDAVQEALLKGYAGLDNYDQSRSFEGWWFAVVRHCCLDLIRRRTTRRSFLRWLGTQPRAVAQPEPGEAEELLHYLEQLTPLQRQILELRYLGDCSYRAIAEALGVPEGTVMSRLHAARQALTELTELYRKEQT